MFNGKNILITGGTGSFGSKFAEVVLETSWWGVKKIYNGVYYLYYGQQESKEDKILKQIEELKKQMKVRFFS